MNYIIRFFFLFFKKIQSKHVFYISCSVIQSHSCLFSYSFPHLRPHSFQKAKTMVDITSDAILFSQSWESPLRSKFRWNSVCSSTRSWPRCILWHFVLGIHKSFSGVKLKRGSGVSRNDKTVFVILMETLNFEHPGNSCDGGIFLLVIP